MRTKRINYNRVLVVIGSFHLKEVNVQTISAIDYYVKYLYSVHCSSNDIFQRLFGKVKALSTTGIYLNIDWIKWLEIS